MRAYDDYLSTKQRIDEQMERLETNALRWDDLIASVGQLRELIELPGFVKLELNFNGENLALHFTVASQREIKAIVDLADSLPWASPSNVFEQAREGYVERYYNPANYFRDAPGMFGWIWLYMVPCEGATCKLVKIAAQEKSWTEEVYSLECGEEAW